MRGVASEVWSSLAAPMQEVLRYALGDPQEVRERVERSRRLHGNVAAAVHTALVDAGAECRRPTAAFYAYPDLGAHRSALADHGIATSRDLAARLLDDHAVATLPGAAFGDPDGALTLRLATSQLYGDSDSQRLAALADADPARLPWIAESVAHLGDAVRKVARTS